MAREEGRDVDRPSGMRAGDWQAERQLQEALRESRQVCCRPACVALAVLPTLAEDFGIFFNSPVQIRFQCSFHITVPVFAQRQVRSTRLRCTRLQESETPGIRLGLL